MRKSRNAAFKYAQRLPLLVNFSLSTATTVMSKGRKASPVANGGREKASKWSVL
jgi:hypothetical protein